MPDAPARFFSREDARRLAERIIGVSHMGTTVVEIDSWWAGELKWARNRVSMATDRRTTSATIRRTIDGAEGKVNTNQFDETSIVSAVRAADRLARWHRTNAADMITPRPVFDYPETHIWSDATFASSQTDRAAVAERAATRIEQQKVFSAGYLDVQARSWACISSDGLDLYVPETQAACTMTVRHPSGTGSGWAGASSYAWTALDFETLTERSLQKCLTSQNPVAIEPGRYTAILEPQAVADLMRGLLSSGFRPLDRLRAEQGAGPFAGPQGNSQLGQRVADSRITISHDPSDPQLGVRPFSSDGDPHRRVTWIEHGVLTALSYSREYALSQLYENLALPNSGAFRMSGGTTTIDEMIENTTRGLLITRLSNFGGTDVKSLLTSAYTRDGIWLIEHGKIAKPVKNFRITESPLFMINKIEALGIPVPVYSPWRPVVVPPLMVRDFNCTALADAV